MTKAYLGDSGIILTAGDVAREYDGAGVWWQWNGGEPWGNSPAPKTVTGNRENDHGSWDATRFYGPRTYPLEGLAHAPDHAALHAAKQRFQTACGLNLQLRCVEPGFDRSGRFRRDGEVLWTEVTQLIARFSAPLWAADPRAYSTLPHTQSTAFPTSIGGLTWPATWPATWAATVAAGNMTLLNAGTENSWPVYRIDGPVVSPTIQNADTGETMRFDLTLGAGEWLTVDTGSHQVLGNGDIQASRRDKFWGDWWPLRPGSNTVRFSGASAGVGALLTATYDDVWI